jgi:DNA-directed RNA polymerase specialized sigma24 family protein
MCSDTVAISPAAEPRDQNLSAFLKREQLHLFDYLLRMTGDRGLCQDAVYDSMHEANRNPGRFSSLPQLRIWLYQFSRERLKDSWNADTRGLGEEAELNNTELQQVAETLMSLAGPHKEVLLLIDRLGFSREDAAGIMGLSLPQLEDAYEEASAKMKVMTLDAAEVKSFIGKVPLHQENLVSNQTSDIIEIVAGVKERIALRDRLFLVLKMLIIMFLISVILVILIKPSLITTLLAD